MTRPPSGLEQSCNWLQMLSICLIFFLTFQLSCLMLDTYPQIRHILIISFPKIKVVANSGDGASVVGK